MIPDYVKNEIRRLEREGYGKSEIQSVLQISKQQWTMEYERFFNSL